MTLDIDELLNATATGQHLPGIVLAVSRNGRLESTHGVGTRILGRDLPPGVDSVFRIASMTKSFTASAVLMLRDAGALALDDRVQAHLAWFDDPTVTIRDLLTMNGGFPTDDPWGDRHESTPLAEFDALVASGVRRIRPSGQGFEYSNLGYALLGRIIATVSGEAYTDFVERRLLAPLGMSSTVFDATEIPDDLMAQGYAQSRSGLVPEPLMAPGAFSPMGGLHSSVRDLTAWVGGFLHALDHRDIAHPVHAASRRDQQQPHTFARLIVRAEPEAVSASSLAYGYGLLVEDHSVLGRFVQHSGGYPGFGSHMRWHPATGIGVVALANRTYAPMMPLVERVIHELVAAEPARPALDRMWPETVEAMAIAEALLGQWDSELADRHFAHNMDLDSSRSDRRNEAAELAQAIGAFSRDATSVESRTPAHARWRVAGRAGTVLIELLMSPDAVPRIQMLRYERASGGN